MSIMTESSVEAPSLSVTVKVKIKVSPPRITGDSNVAVLDDGLVKDTISPKFGSNYMSIQNHQYLCPYLVN
jgi:hypothetical protein